MSTLNNKYNQIKFDSEPIDGEFQDLVKDFFGMKGVYLLTKRVDELRKLDFIKKAEEYFLMDNNKKGLITFVAEGFTDYFVNDIKLKMIICFIKSAYLMKLEDDLEWLMQILDNALDSIGRKMFDRMVEVMDAEPYENVLTFMNQDFVESITDERFQFINEGSMVKITDLIDVANGLEPISIAEFKSINIFELARTIFYKAFKIGKDFKSRKLFKRFFEEMSMKYLSKHMSRLLASSSLQLCQMQERKEQPEQKKTIEIANKLLQAGEVIIRDLWEYLPELEAKKRKKILLKNAPLREQINSILAGDPDSSSQTSDDSLIPNSKSFGFVNEVLVDGSSFYANFFCSNYLFDIPKLRRVDISLYCDRWDDSEAQIADPDEPQWQLVLKRLKAGGNIDARDLNFDFRNRRCVSATNADMFKMNEVKKYVTLAADIKEESERVKYQGVPSYFPVMNPKKEGEHVSTGPKVTLDYELNDSLNSELQLAKPIMYFRECRRYICAGCGFFIPHKKGIDALNVYWHEEHFRCGACNVPLLNMSFALYRGVPLCKKDYEKVNLFSCSRCGYPIYKKDAMFCNGKFYHSCHLGCTKCGKLVKDVILYLKKGKPFCADCTQGSMFDYVQCVYCRKLISFDDMTFEDDLPWHRRCYLTCIHCRQELKKDDLVTFGYDLRICLVCLPLWNILESKDVLERQE